MESAGILSRQLCQRQIFEIAGRKIIAIGSRSAFEAEAVVGVTLHNQAVALGQCLKSIGEQAGLSVPVTALVLDDNSRDAWWEVLECNIPPGGLVIARVACGTAAMARNCLLDLADAAFPSARWVARLDADDRFAFSTSLSSILKRADGSQAKFILAGNRLRRSGQLLERVNSASDKLLDASYVLSRLKGMALGEPEAELPSCNLLLANRAGWRYPEQASGEDHWLVAELLLRYSRQGAILSEPFYADYELEGAATSLNRQQSRHLSARQHLLQAALVWAGMKGAKL